MLNDITGGLEHQQRERRIKVEWYGHKNVSPPSSEFLASRGASTLECGRQPVLALSSEDVLRHAPGRVVGPMEKPHRGSKTTCAGQTRKIQARDGGFKVRRKYGLPLLGAPPRFQALTDEQQTLEVEPVSRSADDMTGPASPGLATLPRNLQHGAVAPSLGPPHEMT